MYLSFTQFIKQLPFLRLIVPFMAGIIIQLNFSPNAFYFPYLFVFFLIIIFLTKYLKGDNLKFRYRFISGLSANLMFILLGAWLLHVNIIKAFQEYPKDSVFEAIISEPLSEKENSYKTIAHVKKYSTNDSVYSLKQTIVIYFEKDSFLKSLNYGDEILFKARINEVTTQGNPYEFNYKQYLFRKGITGQTYLKTGNYIKTNTNKGNLLFSIAYKAREKLAQIYRNHGISNQEFAVLQALTLGDKSEIDEGVRQAYVSSGAMHILAVSGLHVGIIYVLLNFFFRFLDKLKSKKIPYGKILKAGILIILLWAFAFISGLSPSVRRAALMFSFVIIGRAMNNKVNIYNSLAASAFILLIINPYLITEVGFQLSYAAVFAIIFFQPRIVNLLVIKNKVLYYIWSLTAVSIAAQIGTAPISLFYFHIFPNYFFLTNIIVIPAATLIIYGAFALLMTSFIPYISTFFAVLLKHIIAFLNYSVNFIEQIPYSHFNNISFNSSDLIFSGLIIIVFSSFIAYKRARSIQFILILSILWIGMNTIQKITIDSNRRLFVYNIKNTSAINIIGENNILISDPTILKDKSIHYGIMNNWMHLNKTDYNFVDFSDSTVKTISMMKKNNFIHSGKKTILIIRDESQIKFQTKQKLKVDFIIISSNPKIRMADVLRLYETELIIIDSSNKYYNTENFISECEELHQNYYSVVEKGAFTASLYTKNN